MEPFPSLRAHLSAARCCSLQEAMSQSPREEMLGGLGVGTVIFPSFHPPVLLLLRFVACLLLSPRLALSLLAVPAPNPWLRISPPRARALLPAEGGWWHPPAPIPSGLRSGLWVSPPGWARAVLGAAHPAGAGGPGGPPSSSQGLAGDTKVEGTVGWWSSGPLGQGGG